MNPPVSGHGEWLPLLIQCLQHQGSAVRAVIAEVRGSAPRETGASMIVTAQTAHGTIGGGRLEWEVLRSARGLLAGDAPAALLRKFVLGPELGQCCGGVVEVWMERYTRQDSARLVHILRDLESGAVELRCTLSSSATVQRALSRSAQAPAVTAAASLQHGSSGEITLVELLQPAPTLWLYGAGHVGHAVVRIVAELPWQVTWIDSRAEALAGYEGGATIRACCAREPVATVEQAPSGACFLVMTHSHALDYAVCRAILSRGDYRWVGLIGSSSKSARFRAQLRRDGLPATEVDHLVCPIGITGIHDKHPTAIAVSVVAQLLQHFQRPMTVRVELPPDSTEHCAHGCSRCGAHLVSS
jgi:xanthine dehydrogenase accessory factor